MSFTIFEVSRAFTIYLLALVNRQHSESAVVFSFFIVFHYFTLACDSRLND